MGYEVIALDLETGAVDLVSRAWTAWERDVAMDAARDQYPRHRIIGARHRGAAGYWNVDLDNPVALLVALQIGTAGVDG